MENVFNILSQAPVAVAPLLLGGIFTVRSSEGSVSIRLTEVEAYGGGADPGSHAFRGRSARNASMFAAPGTIYVYFVYGMHHCVNIVCDQAGKAGAVLLRAGQVVEGMELARTRNRSVRSDLDVARGPARLCKALGLTRADDGARLGGANPFLTLQLATGVDANLICAGPRTGVRGRGGDGKLFPWRFWLADEPTVSPYRPAKLVRAGNAQ